MSEKKRIVEYDIAKGIGILLVIVGHILPSDNILRLIIYSFHMPLFFIISGFVGRFFSDDNSRILDKSEIRLLTSYYLFSVIYFFFDIIVRFLILHEVRMNFFVRSIYETFVFYGKDTLWFISSLVFGKILTKYIWRIFKEKKLIIIFIGAVCVLLPSFMWNANWKVTNDSIVTYLYYFPLNFVFRTIVSTGYIILGSAFANTFKTIIRKKYFAFSSLMLFFNVIVVLLYHISIDYHGMLIGNVLLAFFLAVTGLLGILGVSSLIKQTNICKLSFLRLSKSSLFIMATHNYFKIIMLVSWLISLMNVYVFLQYALTIIVVVMLECILCILVEKLFNKIVDHITTVFYNVVVNKCFLKSLGER